MGLSQSGLRTRRANQPKITPPITSFSYCLCFNSHGPQPDSRKVSVSIFPVRVRKSVIVPSNAVTRRNGKQAGGRRLALRASLRPQLALWLAWLAGWLAGWKPSHSEGVICLTLFKKKKKKKKKHQEGLICPNTARSKDVQDYTSLRHLSGTCLPATGNLSGKHLLLPAGAHLITVCCSRPAGTAICPALHRADTLRITVPAAATSGAQEARPDNISHSRKLNDNSRNTWLYNLWLINVVICVLLIYMRATPAI